MRARCALVAAMLALGLAAALPGAAVAASLTWGYSFQRDRATAAPVALEVPPARGAAPPRVVPLPGASQSTPVVAGGVWYEWTYWDGGRRGSLWSGRLGPGGGSSAGTAVRLPGQAGPVVAASAGEAFDQPSDAAISPDRRWVAFSAGKYLYWWPSGDPGNGARVELSGPGRSEANSTSPTFVPDPTVSSGWAVCAGNWDGALRCYAVAPGPFHPALASYLVTMTTPADGGGYTPITSSAAYDPATGEVYFGVASWHDPRVVALDPLTGRYRVLGGAGCACALRVAAPVDASVAVAAGAVYATDVLGDVYRFDAASGRLTAWYQAATNGPGGTPLVDIVSPAVAGGVVFTVVGGYRYLLALDARTLAPLGRWTAAAGAGGASALTIATAPGAADEVFYGREAGGVGVALPACRLGTPPPRGCAPPGGGGLVVLGSWAGAPTDGGGHNFTAPVLDGGDVLLWSNEAARAWLAAGDPGVGAAPVGYRRAATPGGLQIYHMGPRLSALVEVGGVGAARLHDTAALGGRRPALYVLQPPGALATAWVVAPGGASRALALQPYGVLAPGGAPCPVDLSATGAVGAFPFAAGPWPAAGCGPLASAYPRLAAYAAAQAAATEPGYAGIPPQQWRDAGVAYAVWRAPLPAPAVVGAYRVDVSARMPDGTSVSARVWYQAACPAPTGADASGRCVVCLSSGACCQAGGGCGPPTPSPPGCASACAAPRCPAGVAPGVGGMTHREYSLLCEPPPAWLTDPAVTACYGNWWAEAARQPAEPGCGPSGP